jgi:catechol 2,3-dioxygenase-like lactoylglutathione lyase family enzyme
VPVETIGIDHIYVTVRDLKRSETFYDRFFEILGFRKNESHRETEHRFARRVH